jgi:hypothetical protein
MDSFEFVSGIGREERQLINKQGLKALRKWIHLSLCLESECRNASLKNKQGLKALRKIECTISSCVSRCTIFCFGP